MTDQRQVTTEEVFHGFVAAAIAKREAGEPFTEAEITEATANLMAEVLSRLLNDPSEEGINKIRMAVVGVTDEFEKVWKEKFGSAAPHLMAKEREQEAPPDTKGTS